MSAVIEIDPCSDEQWERLQLHGGSLFTSSAWLSAVGEAYGLEPTARLLLDDAGRPSAGVAYCLVDDLRGRRLVSFPFSDYHEPLGARPVDVVRLLSTFSGGTPSRFRMPVSRVQPEDPPDGFECRSHLLLHRMEIAGTTAEERFAALHPKVRQNIRRSRNAGVQVDIGSDIDRVRDFYDLHLATRTRKYRLLPQPFDFFEAIHRHFAPSGALVVALARLDGRAIAGVVYIEVGGTLYYKFNASAAEDLTTRPNEQLVLAGVEQCAARGLNAIDLGISEVDQPGLVRYKRKLASTEAEVVTLQTTARSDEQHRHGADFGALLPRLTELFTDDRVPPDVAERAGALLYRYFA